MNLPTIHVVGGGLVGSLVTIFVARKGFKVALHERRPDMRRVDIPAGRSINLAVTARGLKALEDVGLRDKILALSVPMRGRMLHDTHGKTSFVPYGQKASEVINSVSRGSLNKVLLEKAGSYENVEIAFNHRCQAYDQDASTLTFVNDETARSETVSAKVILGADGAWSVIRKTMLENLKDFNYSQEFLEHGYKELIIPPAPDGEFRMEKNALHIWPRKSFMLIALPNLDGSFTCTLFFPHQGEESFAALQTEGDVQAFFTRVFPDAVPVMPTLARDFFSNPTGSMVTVKCKPWHVEGRVLLLGDAAHAIVPFFGQGMNCGFEDCSALGELMDRDDSLNWNDLFKELEFRRKPNADAIADMALENFIEMRDTVADPKFQLKKQIGFELERRYPNQFIPRYAMVVFHPEIPYAHARQRSEIQDKILEELCTGISSLEQINWGKADQLIRRLKSG
jgi:kynurenine 3-monooxygenase